MQSTSWNAGLEEAQAGIKIAGKNINNLRYADDITFMLESEEGLKSLVTKVKEQSEKRGLKLNTQKMKIMESGPIISWEVNGETVETVSDLRFGAPKSLQMVTAALKLKDTYSLEGLLSHFSRVQFCVTPQTAAHQAPPSLGFSRQEHWSGLPFSSPMHESEK